MDNYNIITQLGSGSFGRVLKVSNKNQPQVPLAIKIISLTGLSQKQRDAALNQVRLLASIHSPNVISYHDAFFDGQNQNLCIVMQYADGGDLAGLIKRKRNKQQRFNQNFIWQVSYDLLKGLNTLHKSSIIHRDLKPGNIFFVNGIAKLGDLNISKVTQSGFASTQAGTPYYTCPQIWNGDIYDSKCDIWSLGCLMYQCAALRPPFMAPDFPSLRKKIVNGSYQPIPTNYSQKMEDIIRCCLKVNFKQRPSASQILSTQEGSVNLLSTIRCPRVLKMLNQKLPKQKSLKKSLSRKQPFNQQVQLKKMVSQEKLRQRVSSNMNNVNIVNEIRLSSGSKENEQRKRMISQDNMNVNQNQGMIMKVQYPQIRRNVGQSPNGYRRVR